MSIGVPTGSFSKNVGGCLNNFVRIWIMVPLDDRESARILFEVCRESRSGSRTKSIGM